MIASILSPYLTSLKIPTTAHKRKLSVMAASLPFWELRDLGTSQPQAAGVTSAIRRYHNLHLKRYTRPCNLRYGDVTTVEEPGTAQVHTAPA